MKRLTILTAVLILLLAGCGGKEEAPAATPESLPSPAAELPTVVDTENPNHDAPFERPTGDLVEIGEKLFVTMTNDIYLHPEDYVGKTLKYEGIYQTTLYESADISEQIHYVIRYGPGCCGFDDNAGFEVAWDGDYPEVDDWVEVVGVLRKEVIDEEYDYYYLVLDLESMTVKEERGAEYVMS